MIRDVAALSEIAGDPKSRNSDQTILTKQFKNGSSLKMIGADSPGGFRRITARVVLFDEIDGYAAGGAGSEGDQIALGVKRAETYWNRRIIIGSTPTIKGLSRIDREWEKTDQRHYHVPCPACGAMQILEWGGPDTPYGMKWDKDEDGNGIPESVYYVCKGKGCIIHDVDKPEMVAKGEWRAAKPFTPVFTFGQVTVYFRMPRGAIL
jgi:phage terminase large subunit GpA-like protein